ncbi:hypothetical protein FQA39_LY13149 [Lamprigera yunnana]|nr:hypothetical protein FQA39_LY13149 [Lamprigera yunnana]
MNDEKLIELVRQYPPLYNLAHSKYMDTEFKNAIWIKIGDEMKTTDEDSQHGHFSNLPQRNSTVCPTPRKNPRQLVSNAHPPKTAAATDMEYLVNKVKKLSFPTQQHPVDAFLLGIAPALKKLLPRHWHFAKSDIFAAVQKYELKMLMDQEQKIYPEMAALKVAIHIKSNVIAYSFPTAIVNYKGNKASDST